MGIKKLLSIAGLGLFAVVSAAAGVALAKKPQAEAVKATDDDKLFSVVIDLGDIPTFSNFHKPELHYYGTSIDKYAELHLLNGTYYTTTVSYCSTEQTIDHLQFLYKQEEYGNPDVDKWSTPYEMSVTADYVYHFAFDGTWSGDNWNITKDTWDGVPRVRGTNIADTNMVADVAAKTYKATITVPEATLATDTYQIFFGKWNFGAVRTSSVNAHLDDYTLNSFKFKSAGTYDIICYNSYEDDGIFGIKDYYGPTNDYIYYVTESDNPTVDYIYTFGGSEQFGAWPGKKLTDSEGHPVSGVEEVTRNGVLHFQGSETPHLIYKIEVQIGYPVGDDMFQLNNGSSSKSADRALSGREAYWWTGNGESDACAGLNFLLELEDARNEAKDYAVCNISKETATILVNRYNSMGAFIQATYIDCSKVYTYDPQDKSQQTLVSVHAIMVKLSEISGVDLAGGFRASTTFQGVLDSSTLMIVVAIIGITSISTVGIILVIKKRKHN